MDTVDEGDCLLCAPEDPSTDSSSIHHHKRGTKIPDWVLGLGGLAACFVSIIAIIVIICSFTIRKMDRYERRGNGGQTYSKVPKRLSLAQIKTATMGFNQNRIVGEGASATVYRGSIPSGLAVAVKRFKLNKVHLFLMLMNGKA